MTYQRPNPKWGTTFDSAMPLSYIASIIRMYVNAKAELVTLAGGLRPERRRWLGDEMHTN